MAKKKATRHKSALKAQRQAVKHTLHNRRIKKDVRSAVRDVIDAAKAKDVKKIAELTAKASSTLDKAAKLKEPWTLHDLRRTVRTGFGTLGVLPHVAEAALNHLPPKLIRTYDRNSYAKEIKAALDLWAGHLAVAVAQANGANVTRLQSRK